MNQGDIYLARVYYTSLSNFKIRPVVLVSKDQVADIDVLISPITSQPPKNLYDIVIEYWEEAGLEASKGWAYAGDCYRGETKEP